MSSALSSPGAVSPARSPVKKSACSSSSGRSSPVRCNSPANKPAACSPLQYMGRRTGSTSSSMAVACMSSSLAATSISSATADPLTGHHAGHSQSPSQLNSGCIRPLSFGSSKGLSISRPGSAFGLMHSSGSSRGPGLMCYSTSSSSSSSGQPGPSGSDHIPRPVSPVSTVEPYTAAAPSQNPSGVAAPHHHSSTVGSSSAEAMSSSAAAAAEPAAAALPSVGLLPFNGTAARAAAAEAEAAVTATTSVADIDGQLTAAAPAQAGLSLQAELQDMFTLLKFQVSAALPSSQQAQTLMAIVKYAAADKLPIAALMSQERLTLLQQLLRSDPSVAVLAAEIFCRVASQDIKPWAQQLLPVVTELLAVVQDNTQPKQDEKRVPLVFFAVSALVRMSSVTEIAGGIVQAGGVPVLVAALSVSPPAVCQVTTFSLFRLMREVDGDMTEEQLSAWQPGSSSSSSSSSSSTATVHSSSSSSSTGTGCSSSSSSTVSSTASIPSSSSSGSAASDLLLLQYVRQGAFSKLCDVMAQVEEGSAHELAFSMLLSIALIPRAQQLVADRHEVQSIVKVLTSVPSTSSTRLEAMLVLARLAARCVACQQDAVREGVVPVLVGMMQQGSDEERCHASRLLAILGQHASTHQVILQSGALEVVLRVLRDRGHCAAPGTLSLPETFTPDIHQPPHVWQAAHAMYNTAVAAGMSEAEASACSAAAAAAAAAAGTGSSSSSSSTTTANTASGAASSTAVSASRGVSICAESAPGKQEKQQQGSAAAGSAGTVGPSLVLEQAVGVVCMLCHNPDNHFGMVGDGLVPLLVSLLHKDTPSKTLTYTLASLLMLATAEPRHAAVVARTGAVCLLVSIARESCAKPQNRELAAALLAVLCRSQDAQVEVVAAGGIIALSRLLVEGTDGARCYSCEALVQIAAVSDVRSRLVVRAGALEGLRGLMQPGSSSLSLMWGARLLKALAQDQTSLKKMCETPGLIALLPEVLSRRPGDRWPLHSSSEAAVPSTSTAAGSSRSTTSRGDLAAPVLPAIPTVNGVSLVAEDHEFECEDGREGEGSEDSDLEKAQAQVAWLVAALSTDILTRRVIAEVGSFLVRPLVIILRDSQAGQGSGYSLADVLDGLSNSRQAAAAAALRAMSRADDRLAAMINAELALQLWLGHRVELPHIVEDWPSAPGWY